MPGVIVTPPCRLIFKKRNIKFLILSAFKENFGGLKISKQIQKQLKAKLKGGIRYDCVCFFLNFESKNRENEKQKL